MLECRFEFDISNGTTNRFIFQIINLLIESWGVRLTCLDCLSYAQLITIEINNDSQVLQLLKFKQFITASEC